MLDDQHIGRRCRPQGALSIVVIPDGGAYLLGVVLGPDASGHLARLLNVRQEQADDSRRQHEEQDDPAVASQRIARRPRQPRRQGWFGERVLPILLRRTPRWS